MEVKEAIRRIEDHMTVHHIGDYPHIEIAEALDMAIEALRKQIPEKPFDKSNNQEDWHIMCCPTCKRVFWNSGNWLHYEPIRCDKCGQQMDWSEQHPYRE